MKRHWILVLAALAFGCAGPADPVAEAAIFVARDLLPAGPQGLAPHLGGEWETGDPEGDTISAGLLRRLETATGLPVASPRMVSGGASPLAVLFLFRPEPLEGDTVRVRAGWIGFTGRGGGSGQEYEYVLACPGPCTLVTRRGPDPVS